MYHTQAGGPRGTLGQSGEWGEDSYTDSPWYIEAAEWLFSWVGTFSSPGAECAQLMTWRTRYACTFEQAGGPCPGAPDPRRAAEAARVDPSGAERIRQRLASPINAGLAPTVKEMQDPVNALLWVHACMGGWDCIARTDPELPDDMISWVQAATPGWDASSEDPGEVDAWTDLIFQAAREEGREAAEDVLQRAAQTVAGAIPTEWRKALERGVAQYYLDRGAGAARAGVGPLVLVGVAGWIGWELLAASRR